MNRKAFTIGLALAGILALLDLALLVVGNGEYPPRAIAAASAVLGVATLIGIVLARRGNRAGAWTIIVSRILSALGAAPALALADVPKPAALAAAAVIATTVVTLVLLLPGLRSAPTPAR